MKYSIFLLFLLCSDRPYTDKNNRCTIKNTIEKERNANSPTRAQIKNPIFFIELTPSKF